MGKLIKKSILLFISLVLLSAITNAQEYNENTRIVNVGLGIGYNYYRAYRGTGYSFHSTPVICVSYEQAYKEKVGPGYLGIGGLITFQSSSSKYQFTDGFANYQSKYSWKNYVIAARAVYHWEELMFDDIDIYGGIVVGPRFQTYSYSSDYTGSNNVFLTNSSTQSSQIYIVASLLAGARWYFGSKAALYGEVHLGAGVPYLSGGLSIKI